MCAACRFINENEELVSFCAGVLAKYPIQLEPMFLQLFMCAVYHLKMNMKNWYQFLCMRTSKICHPIRAHVSTTDDVCGVERKLVSEHAHKQNVPAS